jgi:hypothetical protein
MDRADVGSWIGGPLPEGSEHRGERLGLPADGPGSMAGTGRRVLALLIDWLGAYVISLALLGGLPRTPVESFLTMGIFLVEVTLLTWLIGASFGQRLLGIRVVGRTRRLGLTGAALRTLLICLAIPPLIWDADGRGLHDRAVDSLCLRA